MLSDQQRADLREKLSQQLSQIGLLNAATQDSRRPVELDQQSVGRISRIDAMQQQAMALATEQRRRAERHRIEAAFARMESGDYGYCVRCGDDIPYARLQIDPTTMLCLPCMREDG